MDSAWSVAKKTNLIFVHGKGGVGKTVVSLSLARWLSQQGHNTLWVSIEDPLKKPGELNKLSPTLTTLNCEAMFAFEEYASLKIKISAVAKVFIHNKLVRYLAKAAPGIRELLLLGKIWHERTHYQHVVVDMPSTGYALTMFHATRNFSHLFTGGLVYQDACAMLETLNDSSACAHVILATPEEMPLREALDLRQQLRLLFSNNAPLFVANRLFPQVDNLSSTWTASNKGNHDSTLIAETAPQYILNRTQLEQSNLNLWRQASIEYTSLPLIPISTTLSDSQVAQKEAVEQLTSYLERPQNGGSPL